MSQFHQFGQSEMADIPVQGYPGAQLPGQFDALFVFRANATSSHVQVPVSIFIRDRDSQGTPFFENNRVHQIGFNFIALDDEHLNPNGCIKSINDPNLRIVLIQEEISGMVEKATGAPSKTSVSLAMIAVYAMIAKNMINITMVTTQQADKYSVDTIQDK